MLSPGLQAHPEPGQTLALLSSQPPPPTCRECLLCSQHIQTQGQDKGGLLLHYRSTYKHVGGGGLPRAQNGLCVPPRVQKGGGGLPRAQNGCGGLPRAQNNLCAPSRAQKRGRDLHEAQKRYRDLPQAQGEGALLRQAGRVVCLGEEGAVSGGPAPGAGAGSWSQHMWGLGGGNRTPAGRLHLPGKSTLVCGCLHHCSVPRARASLWGYKGFLRLLSVPSSSIPE